MGRRHIHQGQVLKRPTASHAAKFHWEVLLVSLEVQGGVWPSIFFPFFKKEILIENSMKASMIHHWLSERISGSKLIMCIDICIFHLDFFSF